MAHLHGLNEQPHYGGFSLVHQNLTSVSLVTAALTFLYIGAGLASVIYD